MIKDPMVLQEIARSTSLSDLFDDLLLDLIALKESKNMPESLQQLACKAIGALRQINYGKNTLEEPAFNIHALVARFCYRQAQRVAKQKPQFQEEVENGFPKIGIALQKLSRWEIILKKEIDFLIDFFEAMVERFTDAIDEIKEEEVTKVGVD